MSTTPSALEQLEQQTSQAAPQQGAASNLSPLEQLEQSTQKQQAPSKPDDNATITVPSIAGHMPGVMDFGNKVTPAQAAGGVAAGAVAGAAPFAVSGIAAGAENLLQISEQALEHLGENYPQLTKLATKLGYGAGAAGAYKLLNKLGIK